MKPEDFGIYSYRFNPDGTLDVFEDVFLGKKNLTKLPFKFGKVDGSFYCNSNKLKNLKGAPKIVDGNFWCDHNNLKSLKGAPKIINGNFYCDNNNLTNLKGSPEVINGVLWCYSNNLTSIDGLNINGVSENIVIHYNPNLRLSEKFKFWITLNPNKFDLSLDGY